MKKIIRLPEFINYCGLSKSTIYKRIADGLLPKPISLGARAVGWPDSELEAITDAQIAGKSEQEIKSLVIFLSEQRKLAA
jgi:prophage regulatory protein